MDATKRAVERACRLSMVLATLMAVLSAAGLLFPEMRSAETDAWRIQIEVQDWIDLVLVAPLLLGSALKARRGSRIAHLILGGGLMYAVYTLVIYAFAVRFTSLFLGYCAALGLAVFALIGLLGARSASEIRTWFGLDTPTRFPGALLVAFGVGFALLWLLELVPASVRGTPPASLAEVGLLTNPVHALDLSVTLPSLVLAGALLWRSRPWGFVLAPMLLVFAILTDAAIASIILASRAQGLPADLAVAAGIVAAALVTTFALVLLLRGLVAPFHQDALAEAG